MNSSRAILCQLFSSPAILNFDPPLQKQRMPSHFRTLESHKRGVLSVYRTLLRHSTNLPLVNGISESQAGEIRDSIKDRFRRQRSQMSPFRVRALLQVSYGVEEQLRGLYMQFDSQVLDAILANIALEKETKTKNNKTRDPKKINRFGQPIKYDWENQQDLETQQIQNHLDRYVRMKQRRGELPRVIDPLVLEHIIKPEALHHRAMLDYQRAHRRVSRGAYRVHVTYSNDISFIRGPWRQSRGVSPLILRHLKFEQGFFDYTHYWDQNQWLYQSEQAWEHKTGTVREGEDPWGRGIKEDLREWSTMLDQRRAMYRKYARDVLPSMVKKKQAASDRIHQVIKRRFDALRAEMRGVGPFEDLVGKQTLRELVHKHKFRS